MRFIFNFIFFGFLFYLIYLIFPDAFSTMVGWANKLYIFLKDLFLLLYAKINEMMGKQGETSPSPHQALFLIPFWIMAVLEKTDKR